MNNESWQFVGREEIQGLGINERTLREAEDSRWDPEWMAYWVKADSPLDTWLRLQGCQYTLVIREQPQGDDHENFE